MSERPLAIVPAWRWWTGLLLVAAVAVYLSSLAYAEGLPQVFRVVPQFDKVVHFTVAGLLASFLDGALGRRALFAGSRLAVPLAAVLALGTVAALFWAVRSGQFEDLEGPAHRILMDDDTLASERSPERSPERPPEP